jgi:hypothetical protein
MKNEIYDKTGNSASLLMLIKSLQLENCAILLSELKDNIQ